MYEKSELKIELDDLSCSLFSESIEHWTYKCKKVRSCEIYSATRIRSSQIREDKGPAE